ncbi:cupin domain-containing protein [Simiduia agarivorans]|uniref:Cupin n=1 Tax=Simiduia agarivorans (strain DSM 21679 / JCM 13881 / BCRC 17597 / SA1) TaxID=1117647 RepID=K4L218_SIMAS|nr:cupin domain-containing protein [Simiduia agarivorans]AFV00193.1 cupin [Simiduia agarivorans SA1 = DSM 21679]
MNKHTVLTRQQIAEMAGESKTHFLNANAKRVNKDLGGLVGLTGIGFHLIEVKPGFDSTDYHVHHHEDECVYVLEGEGEVEIGDDIIPVAAGDFIGYPAGGLPHNMRNVGDGLLRCIVVGQRLAHDVVDYPRQHKRLFRNAGLPWDLVDSRQIVDPKRA